MQIRVKMMGVLRKHTPPDGKLTLPQGATIAEALALLDVPAARVNAVSVNGEIERDRSRILEPDDELTLLPPAGGGHV